MKNIQCGGNLPNRISKKIVFRILINCTAKIVKVSLGKIANIKFMKVKANIINNN